MLGSRTHSPALRTGILRHSICETRHRHGRCAVILHSEFAYSESGKKCSNEAGNSICIGAAMGPKETILEKGDHVKVMGKDEFYVFLAEFQGRATLRAGGAKNLEYPTFDVPINQV